MPSKLVKIVANLHQRLTNSSRPKSLYFGKMLEVNIYKLLNPGYPFQVSIETNSYCNRRCDYCPVDGSFQEKLESETFRKVIDELAEWGFKGSIYPYSYNEPLTDVRLFDLLSYAHEKLPESEIALFTNGDLLTEGKIDKLIDSGVSRIVVSLHEPSTEEHIEKIYSLKEKYSLIDIKDMRPGSRNAIVTTRGGAVKVGDVAILPRCYFVESMVIRATGNVVICSNDYFQTTIMGNVKEESVRDIWNNPVYARLRKSIRHGKSELDICRNCGYLL